MKRYIVRIIILIISCINLSFQWPLNNSILTSAFGESRGDHFHDGIDATSSSSTVYPIADGELLYFWNKTLFPYDAYTGSGNYMLIQHNDLVSYYLHFIDNPDFKDVYSTIDSIGFFGNTGRSYGNHIHLGVLDKKDWSSVNSLKILPQIDDNEPPIFGALAFYIDGKIVQIKDNAKVRLTVQRPLLVNIFDTSKKNGVRYGIYRLKAEIDNVLIYDITFDKISLNKNALVVNDKVFSEIYLFQNRNSKPFHIVHNSTTLFLSINHSPSVS